MKEAKTKDGPVCACGRGDLYFESQPFIKKEKGAVILSPGNSGDDHDPEDNSLKEDQRIKSDL